MGFEFSRHEVSMNFRTITKKGDSASDKNFSAAFRNLFLIPKNSFSVDLIVFEDLTDVFDDIFVLNAKISCTNFSNTFKNVLVEFSNSKKGYNKVIS